MKLGLSPEIEELLNEKAALEAESRGLEGEQKQLELRVKTLCQKIIQELKKRNFPRRETINRLQSKIEELEAQLEKLAASSFFEKASEEASENNENLEMALEEQEKDKNTVFVTTLDEEELQENIKEP
jgi:predicted nuclease with TOPRIM domain